VGPRFRRIGSSNIAWLLAQGPDVIPIPETRHLKHLSENIGSLDFKLSPEEVQEVRKIAERADSVLGERYPAGMIETLYVDTPPL